MLCGGHVELTYSEYCRFGSTVTGGYFERIENELKDTLSFNIKPNAATSTEVLVTKEFFELMHSKGVMGNKVTPPSINKEHYYLSLVEKIFSVYCEDEVDFLSLCKSMESVTQKVLKLHPHDIRLIEYRAIHYVSDILARCLEYNKSVS